MQCSHHGECGAVLQEVLLDLGKHRLIALVDDVLSDPFTALRVGGAGSIGNREQLRVIAF